MELSPLFNDERLSAAIRLRARTLSEAGVPEEEIRARLLDGPLPVPEAHPPTSAPTSAPTTAPAAAATQRAAPRSAADRTETPQPLPPVPASTDEPAPSRDRGPGVNLASEAERLFGALKPPLEEGRGLTLQFIAATSGEGTSSIAREFAAVAARYTDRPILLLDIDCGRGKQFTEIQQSHPHLGRPGPDFDLGLPDATVVLGDDDRRQDQDGNGNAAPAPSLSFHRLGRSSLLVSRLNNPTGTPAHYVHNARWWQQVRSRVALTVVDAPSYDRSADGLAVCSAMDAVVLVVQAEKARLPVIEVLRDQLLGQSAYIAGIVFNKRRFYIPPSVYRWL